MNATALLGEARFHRAIGLLESAGLRGPFQWSRLPGGANNQVFRVDLPGETVLLKAYFVHPDDPRDRLRADFGFASFAWAIGVRALARPIACDPVGNLALFEFLSGRKLDCAEVNVGRVREALAFFRAVNAHRATPAARSLPPASEACFTLAAHLECLRRRVARLTRIEGDTHADEEARALVRDELVPVSAAVLHRVREEAADLGITPEQRIPEEDCCLSPSDFGFHNALRVGERISFIDFEYAGWDDPAKMVADFFCQPERPVPRDCFAEFCQTVASLTGDPEASRRRFQLLLPLYRLKWCCILLNDFLPDSGMRRRFALAEEEGLRKARQLVKVRKLLRDEFPRGAVAELV